jgi:hypothetical protein
MYRYEFHIRITPGQYMDYYRGKIRQVIVPCTTGQKVQFPASLLQKFVSPEGIQGHFVLVCDEHHKCVGLEKLG